MIARFARAWDEPAGRARIIWLFWLISTGFTLFGFGVIFYRAFFPR